MGMDSEFHFGVRTVGQTSLGDALVTFRQAMTPTVERGTMGIRWPVQFEFPFGCRSHARSDSLARHRRAHGEAHGYR